MPTPGFCARPDVETPKTHYEVHFASHRPVRLAPGASLSEHLTVDNSPVLFGCRTGICGTCAVHLDVLKGAVPPPSEDEVALLSLICPGEPRARLACQVDLQGDIRIDPIHREP